MIDTRMITWIHVRSHGRENDPEKQHLLPLNERADRLAERGRRRWVYTIKKKNLNLRWSDVGFVRGSFLQLGQPTFTRLAVSCVVEIGLLCLVGSVGCCSLDILVGLSDGTMSNTVQFRPQKPMAKRGSDPEE